MLVSWFRKIKNKLLIYNKGGYDIYGYNENGFNRAGYNLEGFNKDDYNDRGFNKHGYNKRGYDKSGHDIDGYDIDEYDREGYNKEGIDRLGYDRQGYDIVGYNKNGFDKTGYNKQGINKCGCDRDGFNINNDNEFCFDRTGCNEDIYDKEAYSRSCYNNLGDDIEGYNTLELSKDKYKKSEYKNIEVNSENVAQLNKETNIVSSKLNATNNDLEDKFNGLKGLENREFILTALDMIKENSKVFDGVITYLISRDYCKNTFALQFELLREIKPSFSYEETKCLYYDNANCHYARYYKKNIFEYKSKRYIVCNHWYSIQRDKFIKWTIEKFA